MPFTQTAGPQIELCTRCGHPEAAHICSIEIDGQKLPTLFSCDCSSHDCTCISFWPPSHLYNLNKEK